MVRGHWELHQWLITQGIERPRSAVSRSLNGDVALKDMLRGIGRGFSFEAPGRHIVPFFFLGHWIAGFGVYFPGIFFFFGGGLLVGKIGRTWTCPWLKKSQNPIESSISIAFWDSCVWDCHFFCMHKFWESIGKKVWCCHENNNGAPKCLHTEVPQRQRGPHHPLNRGNVSEGQRVPKNAAKWGF